MNHGDTETQRHGEKVFIFYLSTLPSPPWGVTASYYKEIIEWPAQQSYSGRGGLYGYISGHHEIKEYWTRQWKEINPNVEPVGFAERQNGSLEVEVHQKVKYLQDNLILDGTVKHIYTFEDGLIKTMDIELA